VEEMLDTIGHEAHTVIKLSGMSAEKQPHSTMTVLVLTPEGSAIWAHVGDSRLYRFDGPNFAERTIDHSFVEKLISEGKLTPAEAKNHRLSNLLANVLGASTTNLFVTIKRYDGLKAGDAFLLCTDGLWHYFSDVELGAALAMNSPRDASEMLIKKVHERSAGTNADNCTMAIVKLVAVPKETKDYKVGKMRRAV
jgi:serine/threonine protein phosphatase PrpC